MATKKTIKKAAAKKPAPGKAKPKSVKKVIAPKKVVKSIPASKKQAPKKAIIKKAAPVKGKTKQVKAIVKKVAAKVLPAKKSIVKKPVVVVKKVEQKVKAIAKPPVVVKKVEQKVKAIAKPPVVVKKVEPKAKAIVKPPVVVKKVVAKNPKDIKITPAKPVVLPKINTKTSKKYQPDFTKSVLDYKKNDPGALIIKYSDAELREFKDLILRKMEAAKKELNYLQGLITRKDETGGDESENRYMTMEDGSLSMEREQLSQMASRQITFIDHLEKALMRIENKTYGVCRVTGKLIDKARLRAVPHATLSIEAKMGIVK